jgi:hypothetical protein
VVRHLVVSVENLIVRSMNGATATIIHGSVQLARLVNIIVRGVTFGGPAPDQGFTVTNPVRLQDGCRPLRHRSELWLRRSLRMACNMPVRVRWIVAPAGAGIAQENITIQNNRFLNNEKRAWSSSTALLTAIDTIRILNNEFRSERRRWLGLRRYRRGHRPPRPRSQRGH